MAAPSTTSGSLDSFDVAGACAVVEWSKPDDGRTRVLLSIGSESAAAGQITFDCHFRPSSSTASFRLRAPMLLKGQGRKITPLFIFIAPERIQSLTYENSGKTHLPDNLKLVGAGDVVALRFKLSRAGDLVVPPGHSPLVPKKKVFWDVLDSLKMLSQEMDFLMYLRQDDLPAEDCLVSFCEAVTAGRLTTSTAHADITRLYDGKGGKLLAAEDLSEPAAAAAAAASVDVPPSYDELGPPPPAPPIEQGDLASAVKATPASSSRKRRRTSSSPDPSTADDLVPGGHIQDTDRVEAVCRKLMIEMTAKWREDSDQLRTELRQMESRMKDWVDERLSKHVEVLRQELQEASEQQRNHVDEEIHVARRETQEAFDKMEEVSEDMQAFKEETSELVDGMVEERMNAVRGELEEILTEKMHEAQDRIVDHIRSNMHIDFSIFE